MTSQLLESSYNKKNPYSSTLLINRHLTEGSDKETRHFEFSLSGSGLSYEPGDSLGVVPTNCSQVVDDLLDATGFTGPEKVTVNDCETELRLALHHQFACTVLSKIQIKSLMRLQRFKLLKICLRLKIRRT